MQQDTPEHLYSAKVIRTEDLHPVQVIPAPLKPTLLKRVRNRIDAILLRIDSDASDHCQTHAEMLHPGTLKPLSKDAYVKRSALPGAL